MEKREPNPEDLPPENLSEEDFIPDSILEPSNADALRNGDKAVTPLGIIDAETFASVDSTLIYEVLDYIEELIYPLAFPVDPPYIADFILMGRRNAIWNAKTIGDMVIATLLNEDILSEVRGPFDKDYEEEEGLPAEGSSLNNESGVTLIDDRVKIDIFTAVSLANGLLDYIIYATKFGSTDEGINRYSREISVVNNYIRDLLNVITFESIEEKPDGWESRPPGYQLIRIPRSGLFACIRILESAVRMFEASIWKTDLFWTVIFRDMAVILRKKIQRWDEGKAQE